MLEESKKLYETSANLYLSDWKSMDKNDLIREAVKCVNTPKYDSYIAAIMLRYWGKMTAYYQRCKLVITPEDAHTWLVQAVLYAVEKHPWTNPKSSIYEDKNGPDKVVNRVLESKRLTFYQQLNRYNRKINSVVFSLDSLKEDMLDAHTPAVVDDHQFVIDDLVIKAFEAKDYFLSFLLDGIVAERYPTGGRHKKMITHLKNIDQHCETFADRYELNLNKVKRGASYITRLSRGSIRRKINITLSELKRSVIKENSIGYGHDDNDSNTYIKFHRIDDYYYVNLWGESETF